MHDLPVAGSKVQAVQWDSETKARVLMNNFPMDQMPPFAAAKFIADLKAGYRSGEGYLQSCNAGADRFVRRGQRTCYGVGHRMTPRA